MIKSINSQGQILINASNLYLNFAFQAMKPFMINFSERKNSITIKILILIMFILKEASQVFHNAQTMKKIKVYLKSKKNRKK